LLLGLLLSACGGGSPAPSETLEAARDDGALEHAVKHANPRYVCPMHPQIVRDVPGSCPICGMDLVERQVEAEAAEQPVVTLTSAVVQSLGVRTTRVARGNLWKYVETVGRVAYDENRLAHVHPRAEGWVETLAVRAEGDPVRSGQVLGQIYAPQILSAQVDFLIALDQGGQRTLPGNLDKARNLLRLLDVPEAVIARLERERQTTNTVPILAPIDGVVTRLGVREGMYVMPATEMYTIADLGRVWVLVDVFEHQLAWLRPRLAAEIRVPAHPGRIWEGVVDYIYPELDPQSRTLRVRLAFANPDAALKPNMFADVVILGGPQRDALHIPREALIVTGKRESVVKALGEGRFQPVDVVTGMKSAGEVEVLSGLAEGDQVVVSGQFLIDSEASLQASFLRMSGGHGGH
jgi:Cu(I)/Ag(I) efflux system membrane fusion protein